MPKILNKPSVQACSSTTYLGSLIVSNSIASPGIRINGPITTCPKVSESTIDNTYRLFIYKCTTPVIILKYTNKAAIFGKGKKERCP